MQGLDGFFEAKKEYGAIFLRLVIGWRLLAGVAAYATAIKPIGEVASFFEGLQLPAPIISAWISVYAQFIGGILLVLGLWVRPVAIVLLINFSIAIIAAHTHDPVEKSFPAWILFAASIFFLFHGAGKLSLDRKFLKDNRDVSLSHPRA